MSIAWARAPRCRKRSRPRAWRPDLVRWVTPSKSAACSRLVRLTHPTKSRRRLPDADSKGADARDLAFELVARNGRGDAGGGSGHDHVAGGKLDHLAELADHLRHAPDHLGEVAVLAHLAVDLQGDAALARMADVCGGL